MLDKTMLVGALKNDQSNLNTVLNEATNIGKIMGKMEFVSGLVSALESGRFDFINNDNAQSTLIKDIDKQLDENLQSEKTVAGVHYTEVNQIIDDTSI
jgi:hypothetical protein